MITRRFLQTSALGMALLLIVTSMALASDADTAVADATDPTGAVTLSPGGSAPITITVTVSGRQDNPATFQINKAWTLAGGAFTGANPEEKVTPARAASADAYVYTFPGTVAIDADQECSELDDNDEPIPFVLAIGVTVVATSAPAALSAGDSSSYDVYVVDCDTTPADTTAPTITITTPPDGATYFLNQVVYADYACEDEAGGSGLASCVGTVANGDAIDTASVGAKTFTVDAADNAGNEHSLTHNYSVIFDWEGFFQPVENLPTWNKAKAGQAIPMKFSLGGDQGLNIIMAGFPKVTQMACPSADDPTDPIEDYATGTANNGLVYDADADQYNYVWKTKKEWAGKCLEFKLKLIDGVPHTANFQFTK